MRPAALGAVPNPVAEIKVRVELRCALMSFGQWPVGLAGSQPQPQPQPRGGACTSGVGRAGVAESRRRRDSRAAPSVQAAQKVGELGEIFLAPWATLSAPCVALLPPPSRPSPSPPELFAWRQSLAGRALAMPFGLACGDRRLHVGG